jgi:Na+/H+ antiporter NhaC
MPPEHFGSWSLLPPLLAITLAIVTRRVIVSLAAGVFVGAMILAEWNPFQAIVAVVHAHLWPSLVDADHLLVFAFTLLMGAMIGVIHRSGGMHGIVDKLAPLARSRRGGQLVTWLLGLIIFFDDYANTLLLGTTMRPLADRLRISREKLAYVVDSTAAPVAGLAVISTWVASEIGYIQDGLDKIDIGGTSGDALVVFVQTIPYRFYVLWALLFVPLVAWLRRDFGPMRAAEKAAQAGQTRPPPGGVEAASTAVPEESSGQAAEPAARHWSLAVAPIAAAVFVIVAYILLTGLAAVTVERVDAHGWISVMGMGDSYLALVAGSAGGLLWAAALAWCWGGQSTTQITGAAVRGTRLMLPVLAILWLAWTLSHVCDRAYLGTGDYLGSLISERVAPWLLPTLVFVIASAVAFSTGTSWGTMAILTPLVIQVTDRLMSSRAADAGIDHPVFLAAVGSVLAGAIFGDHCSPISDTTILSSKASGCPLVAHVWTQLPYAVVVGVVAIVAGTLPIGFGVNVWLLLPLGLLILVGWLLLVGRRI